MASSGEAYDIRTKKLVAQKFPYAVKVEEGKTYYWCQCGRSKNQPFCDGSHAMQETGITPVAWKATANETVYFCGCKQTKSAPFCDGTHKTLPESVTVGTAL